MNDPAVLRKKISELELENRKLKSEAEAAGTKATIN